MGEPETTEKVIDPMVALRCSLTTRPLCVVCGERKCCTVEGCPCEGHDASVQLATGEWVCSRQCWETRALQAAQRGEQHGE